MGDCRRDRARRGSGSSAGTGAALRLWGWAAISRGALSHHYDERYPMSSGYESNGYEVIELDGTNFTNHAGD